MRFPSSHRWTLCFTSSPPKGDSKREFLHFALPFISYLCCRDRHFKFGMLIGHNKPTHDKLSLKWTWSRHVIHFKSQGPKHTSGITEAGIVKFLTPQAMSNVTKRTAYHPPNGCGYGHVTVLKFCRLPWCRASRGFVSDSWATCWDIARYWSKIADLNLPHLYLVPPLWMTPLEFCLDFWR